MKTAADITCLQLWAKPRGVRVTHADGATPGVEILRPHSSHHRPDHHTQVNTHRQKSQGKVREIYLVTICSLFPVHLLLTRYCSHVVAGLVSQPQPSALPPSAGSQSHPSWSPNISVSHHPDRLTGHRICSHPSRQPDRGLKLHHSWRRWNLFVYHQQKNVFRSPAETLKSITVNFFFLKVQQSCWLCHL